MGDFTSTHSQPDGRWNFNSLTENGRQLGGRQRADGAGRKGQDDKKERSMAGSMQQDPASGKF